MVLFFFFLEIVYFLTLKQSTLFANFLCYVMQFINLSNDKSVATSQLGYIPLSLQSQIC